LITVQVAVDVVGWIIRSVTARLLEKIVQIDLLLGCSAGFAVAAIGYVAALLLVKIEKAFIRSKVGSSVKVED
jgi:hypothetical protein